MKNKKLKVIGLTALFLIIYNYFALIPLNIRYQSNFTFIVFIGVALYFLLSKNVIENIPKTIGNVVVDSYRPNKAGMYVIFIAFGLLFVNAISSSPLFFSKEYQTLIGEVKEEEFTEDFSKIEISQLPIVDHNLALLLGDKKLGELRGLGSEFHVGTFSDISVEGKLYAVAPLEYNDFFKWLNNQGTPGYIKVNKVSGDVELVTEINGKALSLEYLPSAYFGKNLKRHTYFNKNMDNRLYSYSFEIDDEGNPYWIISKTHKTIFLNGGDDVLSVVTVNAQSGEVKEYTPAEAPAWIDMIYPKDLVMQQLNDWGIYVNGFWNTVFGEKDIVRTTSGSRRVFNEGSVYHYTGMTSVGADESTVGFMFVNTRTKETSIVGTAGATEEAAMASAQGKVQNLGYYATFPIPININNEPTFFVTLKDNKGLIKQYAFVNIKEYSIVGNGETIEKAKNSYLETLGQENRLTDDALAEEITGKITRIGSSVKDGETTYYIIINKTLYYGSGNISSELNVSNVNDSVTIEIISDRIISFDNLNID